MRIRLGTPRGLRHVTPPRRAARTALLALLGLASAFAAEKQIKVEGQHATDPAVITKVMLRNSEVQCGLIVDSNDPANPIAVQPITPFQADSDWLQNVRLYLLNRTNKTIALVEIILAFPETGDGRSIQSPMSSYHIKVGRLPEGALFSSRTGKSIPPDLSQKPLSFSPGETLPLNLGNYIDQIKASVSDRMAPEALTYCWIRRGQIIFEDGMSWYVGKYSVPDPEQPGKRIGMEPRYFPGVPSWPPGYGTPGHPGYLK